MELEALGIGLSAVCLDFAQKLIPQGVLAMNKLKLVPIEQAKKVLETVKMTEFQIGLIVRALTPPQGLTYVNKVKHAIMQPSSIVQALTWYSDEYRRWGL